MARDRPTGDASLDLVLTPRGHLILAEVDGAPLLDPDVAERLGQAFGRGTGEGLLQPGAGEVATPLPPTFGYRRDFSTRFVTALCARPDTGERSVSVAARDALPPPAATDLDESIASAPPMVGAGADTAVAGDLRAVCGRHRLARGAAPGTVLEGTDLADVSGVELAPAAATRIAAAKARAVVVRPPAAAAATVAARRPAAGRQPTHAPTPVAAPPRGRKPKVRPSGVTAVPPPKPKPAPPRHRRK